MDDQHTELMNLREENARLRAQVRVLQQAEAAAEEASEAKTRFLAMMSHEIRTPLSGIVGLADLLASGALDREQRAYVEAIRGAGAALISLLGEILDLSRIEAGRLDLEDAPFDLAALVEGAAELLAPRAQGKGLEIATFIARDVPRALVGDGARIRQILLNLAGNALKFTQSGGIGISVLVRDDALVFEVADTGPGVPEDRRAAIFENFEQADASSARTHEGAGLGLAISRALAARMGGSLDLARSGPEGSVFVFVCPLRPAPEQPPLAADLSGQSVLVVGPVLFEAPFIAARVRDFGGQAVCVAELAEAAIALAPNPAPGQNRAPNLVIVDCALGMEAVRRIADLARMAGTARVLTLFSPYERRALGAQALAGLDGWLVKPVREASLRARILEQDDPAAEPAPSPDAPPLSRMRILLAEDNPVNALVARKHLASLGASVVHVEDGQAAVSAAAQARTGQAPLFDVILMDMRMPRLDGLGAVRLIREAEAALGAARVRIVALTANAFEQDRRECLAAGFDDFLTKPFEPMALARILVS
jgi:CheY-like chemotaxis protein/nitrogen-specific signal transduction histidine kinase